MELFFNELSLEEKESIDGETVLAFAQVYQTLRKYDITTCRIDSEDNHKLHQMIQIGPNFLNIRNFYFSFFRSPYESEMVEKKQNEYLEHEWSYNGRSCIGFPLAIVLNSATLSIYDLDWNEPFIHIMKDGGRDTARNICTKQHVDIHIPQIQSDQEPELIVNGSYIIFGKICWFRVSIFRNVLGYSAIPDVDFAIKIVCQSQIDIHRIAVWISTTNPKLE